MGLDLNIRLHADSSAAKGIATRKGLGEEKHLETRTHLVQDEVEQGVVLMNMVNGNDKPADLLTNYLSGPEILNS